MLNAQLYFAVSFAPRWTIISHFCNIASHSPQMRDEPVFVTFAEVFVRNTLENTGSNSLRIHFCWAFSFLIYQRQLEFIPLSVSLHTTLWTVDMKPYGTLNLHTTVFLSHTSMRSIVFIIHVAEGWASHCRQVIICIFKQFNSCLMNCFELFVLHWMCWPWVLMWLLALYQTFTTDSNHYSSSVLWFLTVELLKTLHADY